MKKIKYFFLMLLMFGVSIGFAQTNVFTSATNEGGSIILENPLKTSYDSSHRWVLYNMTGPYGNSLQFWNYNKDVTKYGAQLTLADNGNLGIGTSTPRYKLDVNGIVKWGGALQFVYSGQDDNGGYFEQYGKVNKQDNIRIQTSTNGDETNYAQIIIDPKKGFSFYTFGNANGNVGIGTTTPNEKLSVNGNIRSKEVKVEAINWPDYVFEKDYKIVSLEDLEKYIKIHKHLPDVPTAKEVTSNGLELGEMNKALLKKVEELTLYLIEQNKALAEQKNQLIEQQKILENQKEDINNLKAHK